MYETPTVTATPFAVSPAQSATSYSGHRPRPLHPAGVCQIETQAPEHPAWLEQPTYISATRDQVAPEKARGVLHCSASKAASSSRRCCASMASASGCAVLKKAWSKSSTPSTKLPKRLFGANVSFQPMSASHLAPAEDFLSRPQATSGRQELHLLLADGLDWLPVPCKISAMTSGFLACRVAH